MKRAIAIALVAAVGAIALACGGGGCTDDCPPEVPMPAVDCKAKPAQCK